MNNKNLVTTVIFIVRTICWFFLVSLALESITKRTHIQMEERRNKQFWISFFLNMWSAYWKCVWETNGNLYIIKIKFTEWNLRAPSWLQYKYLTKDENDVFVGMHRSIWYAQYLFFSVWNLKQRRWCGHEFMIGQEHSVFIINKYVMAFSWIVELIKSLLFAFKLSVMIVPYFGCVSFHFIIFALLLWAATMCRTDRRQ